jgi:hypothetical protein
MDASIVDSPRLLPVLQLPIGWRARIPAKYFLCPAPTVIREAWPYPDVHFQ